MPCSTPGFPVHHQLLELVRLMSIESVMPSTHLILCHPLFSCLWSYPASGSFPVSQFFASCIGALASVSVLPMNIQDWFPLGWTGSISLKSKGLSRVFSNTTVQKASVICFSAFYMVQLSHPCMTTGKTIALTIWIFVGKVTSLLYNVLFVIVFLPRSKCLLISWVQPPSAVMSAKKTLILKCVSISIVFPSVCQEMIGFSYTYIWYFASSNPKFPIHLSPLLLGSYKSILYFCQSVSILQISLFVLYFRFHM